MKVDRPTTLKADCTHQQRHYHGTVSCYSTCECRCDDCRLAESRYRRRDYPRTVSPLGQRWEPRSPEWLAAMRRGLLTAVVESFERDGESRFL